MKLIARWFVPLGLAASSIAAPAISAAAVTAPSILGDWARNDGAIRTRIAPCGANTCATDFWAKDPNGDEKVGDVLVMTLTESSPGHFEGPAFDVRRDAHYTIKIEVTDKEMTSSGCVLAGIVCKSGVWTRMTP